MQMLYIPEHSLIQYQSRHKMQLLAAAVLQSTYKHTTTILINTYKHVCVYK